MHYMNLNPNASDYMEVQEVGDAHAFLTDLSGWDHICGYLCQISPASCSLSDDTVRVWE